MNTTPSTAVPLNHLDEIQNTLFPLILRITNQLLGKFGPNLASQVRLGSAASVFSHPPSSTPRKTFSPSTTILVCFSPPPPFSHVAQWFFNLLGGKGSLG